MGIIDPRTGEVRYSIAGDMGVYVIGQRGDERSLRPSDPLPALGLSKGANFPSTPEQLDNDETLVVFTPGVTTALNAEKDIFGEERFVNILCDGFGQLASSMLKEMLTELQNFTQGGSQPNDVTVLLAHRV
jgi:sigma-B regulation protein RsbU (phosphoserine phosphatase)